jgi:hypothetical protein
MTRVGFALLLALGACGDDERGLEIVARTPEIGARNVWIEAPITVVFSAPIVSEPVVTLDAAHGVAWSADRTTMTLTLEERPATPWRAEITIVGAASADGRTLPETTWWWDVPMWQEPQGTFDTDPAEPIVEHALAVDSVGRAVVAWREGRAIRAAHLAGPGWQVLGGMVGQTGVLTRGPTLAIDAGDRPVVAWVTPAGAIGVGRWDGQSWVPIPSPGIGAAAILARDPEGTLVLATDASVYALGAGDVWEDLGSPSGAGRAPAALAVAESTIVVAWVERDSSIVTARRVDGGDWESLGTLNRGEGSVARAPALVAVPDGRILAAWEEQAGATWDVRAAWLSAGAWQPFPRAIDVDLLADARAPSLALDEIARPTLAWTEQQGGTRRIWVARVGDRELEPVGGQTVNADRAAPVADTHLAFAGAWPIVTWLDATRIRAGRFNGSDTRLPGLATRPSSAGCRLDELTTTLLSQTGCFIALGAEPTADPGLVPYDVRSPLWSDGTHKRRWIALPDGQTIERTDAGAWDLPVGTLLIKEFSIDLDERDPASRRPIETRVLLHDGPDTWRGYSFQWDETFTDATLLGGDTATTRDWTVIGADGGAGTYHHLHPARGQCTQCHNTRTGQVLGLQTKQLDRMMDYGGVADDQLAAMDRIGLFSTPLGERPADPFTPPMDVAFDLESRARAYLAANCGHCHPHVRSTRDMRWETPLDLPGDYFAEASTRLCGPDDEIVPGDHARSILWQRMSTRPPYVFLTGMPPIGTLVADAWALDVVGAWIDGLDPAACP